MSMGSTALSDARNGRSVAVSRARSVARKQRILMLVQLPPPEHGAAAVNRQVVESAKLAESFDLDVAPISMMEDLAHIRRFEWSKIARSLKLCWTIAARLFGRARPDLVYFTLSPNGWAFYRDLVFVALFRIAGVPRVFHLHGRGVAAAIARAPWRKPLYRFAFAQAFVITLGGLLRRDIDGLVDQDRVFVVPNGIRDMADKPSAPRARTAGPVRILFLSNMLEEKGPFVLLEALAALARKGVPFEARFAGAWRKPLSPDDFAARVAALGLERRVAHLGPVYGAAKAQAFANADIFVLPTHYDHEALPLVAIEAMMHGLPVITTKIGALPEIVVPGSSGELIAPRDVPALAAALEQLIMDADLRAAYGRAARARFESDLTEARFEERLLRVLVQAAERG